MTTLDNIEKLVIIHENHHFSGCCDHVLIVSLKMVSNCIQSQITDPGVEVLHHHHRHNLNWKDDMDASESRGTVPPKSSIKK